MGKIRHTIRTGAVAIAVGLALGAASGAQAFSVPDAQTAQQSGLLHKVTSYSQMYVLFMRGEPFFVTVESDFSAEQNGIDRAIAEQQIADKVYDFIKPIIEHYSGKPAVFLRDNPPKKPADFPGSNSFTNVRVYLSLKFILSEKSHYQTLLNFKIVRMVGMRKLVAGGLNTEIYEDEALMDFSENEPQPPYVYECASMSDCYQDLITKNIHDGLKKYFNDYLEN